MYGEITDTASKRRQTALECLNSNNIPHVVKNSGRHLVVSNRLDYYPTKDWFKDRTTGKKYAGIKNLVEFYKNEVKK
jgi:hypothetical protein